MRILGLPIEFKGHPLHPWPIWWLTVAVFQVCAANKLAAGE